MRRDLRHRDDRRKARVAAASLLVVVLIATMSPVAFGHGAPIAGTDDIHDALVTRAVHWNLTRDVDDRRIIDASSHPDDVNDTLPVTAYRFHGDIGWVEGRLIEHGAATEDVPVFLTGVRPLQIEFAPPLLAGEHLLDRVDLPLLDHDNVTINVTPDARDQSFDRIVLRSATRVPLPDADGISPPVANETQETRDAAGRDAGIRIITEATLSELGESHPEFGDIGSATSRIRVTVLFDDDRWSAADDTTVFLDAEGDLGGSAVTQRLHPTVASDAAGVLFKRNDDYAWIKAAPYVYPPGRPANEAWAATDATARPQDANVSVETRNPASLPLSNASRSALGPFQFTIAGPLPIQGPNATATGFAFEWHLGYAHKSNTAQDEHEGHDEVPGDTEPTPAVGTAMPGIVLLGIVAAARRRHGT